MSGAVGSLLFNSGALQALNGIAAAQQVNSTYETQLSTGLAINSPADNPAGFIAAQGFDSQISGVSQATQNANEGISLLQTAQGAVGQQEAILQKLNSIAVDAANGTQTSQDRQSMQNVVSSLLSQINTIAQQTQYNGINLLDGTFQDKQFQVGANAGQTLNLSIPSTLAASFVTPGTPPSGGSFQSQINTTHGSALFQNGNTAGFITGLSILTGSLNISGSKGTASIPYSDLSGGYSAFISAINATTSTTGVKAQPVPISLTLKASGISASKPITLSIGAINGNAAAIGSSLSKLVTSINDTHLGILATQISSSSLKLSGSALGVSIISDSGSASSISSANTLTINGASRGSIPGDGVNNIPIALTNYRSSSSGSGFNSSSVKTSPIIGEIKLTSSKSFSLNNAQNIGLSNVSKQIGAIGGGSSTLAGIDVTTQASAQNTIATIQSALNRLGVIQAYLGASQQRFQDTLNNLMASDTNLQNGLAVIQDANIPKVSQNLAQSQIQTQTGVAALKSSTSLQQTFLSLLP